MAVPRCFGDDASKLVDARRETIVFETLEGVVGCVEVLEVDGEAVGVRAKTRMAEACARHVPARFRNVSLNLRLVVPAPRRLALHRHLAELQLLLRPFAR